MHCQQLIISVLSCLLQIEETPEVRHWIVTAPDISV
jgi:hypothetical protein